MPLPNLPHDAFPFRAKQFSHPVLHLPLLLQVQKKRGNFEVRFTAPACPPSRKNPPPPQEASALFSQLRFCAPVLGSEGQVPPPASILPMQDVCGDVRLRPPLVGLQGDQTLCTQRGDLSPAAGRLDGAQVCGGRRGRRRAKVNKRSSHQLL